MKNTLTILAFFFLSTYLTNAQITVQYNDYMSGSVGDTLKYFWTANQDVDLGQPGQSMWDFSNLTSENLEYAEFLNAGDSPYADSFPDAEICIHQFADGEGQQIFGYVKNESTQVLNYGEIITNDGQSFSITYSPARKMVFPVTFGSTWTDNVSEVYKDDNGEFPTPLDAINHVDAYGKLTLPDGRTVDALKLVASEIRDFGGTKDTTYTIIFLTNTGDMMMLFVGYGEPTTGLSSIGSITWIENVTTDVRENIELPKEFTLKQNYPNPFNPSTNIEFSIPSADNVNLKIYNS